ncbi:MAG: hypothetical protein GC155_11415 [Alphaproteobacteria bacterium]|nr:hypothetical protein [Alphaproteobacteria bacterium]
MRRTLLLAACALALSACGLQGRLERPPPLWGDPPNEGPNDPRTLKAERDKAAAEKAKKRADEEAERARRAASAETPDPSTSTTTPP